MTWLRTLGIVGGLGPHAHIGFEQRLLQAVGTVDADQDYPPWLLASIPGTPDRTAALLTDAPSPVPQLVRGLRLLEGRADFAMIACNTAHAFLDEVRREVEIPIFDVVRETARYLRRRLGDRAQVGLLATDGSLATKLYPRAAHKVAPNLRWVSLLDLPAGERDQQRLVMDSIYGERSEDGRRVGGIKSGSLHSQTTGRSHAEAFEEAIGRLGEAGAEAVVLGCTEISLVLPPDEDHTPLRIDPMALAAERCLRIARGDLPLPDADGLAG